MNEPEKSLARLPLEVNPSSKDILRFWKHVAKEHPDKCWIWKLKTNRKGYGKLNINHENFLAHRISWVITNGPIPSDICVLHHCDNPSCVNPHHLFLGTRSENNADSHSKRRGVWQKGEKKRPELILRGTQHANSVFTEEDVREIRTRLSTGEQKSKIASDFGVSIFAIYAISKRLTWAHLV